MKNKLKKLISLIAVVTVLTAAVPVARLSLKSAAAQAGIFEYEVNDGEVTITSCDESVSGIVEIPDLIEELPVTAIGDSAFSFCGEITAVTFPESLVTIGSSAFSGCSALESVTIPEGVFSISDDAFTLCPSITSFDVSDKNPNYASYGNGVLYNKELSVLIRYPAGSKAPEFTVPSSVTVISGSSFENSDNLVKVTIGDSVTSLNGSAFFSCDALETVNIGSGISVIGDGAFEYCTSLKSVTIPENVTLIGESAFCDCTALEEVIIGNGTKAIGDYAFSYTGPDYEYFNLEDVVFRCFKDSYAHNYAQSNGFKFSFIDEGEDNQYKYYILDEEVTVTGYNGELPSDLFIPQSISGYPVKSIDSYAFEGNDDINAVYMTETLTSIGSCAFKDCELLEEVIISASVETIGKFAFAGCYSLKSYKVDDNSQSFSADSQGVLFNKDKTTLISYPVGNTAQVYTAPDGVENIGEYAFSQSRNLKEIVLPESVKAIGAKAFENCTAVKEFIMPDSIESIGDFAFSGCTSLVNLTVGSSVKTIGYEILENCAVFKNVYYNSTQEQWKEIAVDEVNTVLLSAQIHYIGAVQNALRYLEYTVIDGEVKITKCDTAARGELEIPAEIDGLPVTSIANYAFFKCSGITAIILPESLKNVERMAFKDCSSLKTVCLFPGVSIIGTSAFEGCSSINRVLYYGTRAEFEELLKATGSGNEDFMVSVIPTFLGDVNSDGKINSSDALTVLQHATGIKTIEYKQINIADVSSDGKVNSSDALMLLQYATGIIDFFNKPAA